MKFPAVLIFCTAPLFAGTPSVPTFSEKLPSVPDLSLSGNLRPGDVRAPAPEAQAAAKSFSNRPVGATRYVSRMPVIDPGDRVDRAMPVVRPRDDVAFSMVIRTPRVDSVDALAAPAAGVEPQAVAPAPQGSPSRPPLWAPSSPSSPLSPRQPSASSPSGRP